MLVSVLPVPFGDSGRQRQYEAVRAALEAETAASATVLLGNLGAFLPIQADMVVVRPTGVALGVLLPQAGLLTIPALASGAWLLDGQPLPGRAESDNPFAQYQRQLPPVLAWVGEQLTFGETVLLPAAGLVLFEAPLAFGPGVEAELHYHAAGHDFQLVGGAAQVPGRLRQLFASNEAILTEDELLDWADYLMNGLPDVMKPASVLSPADLLAQKLRQLWHWLGAEDIPADPPYGALPPGQHLRDLQEQARLHQLRQELQAELHQQRQEAAAREAAHTRELTLLRQQLAQTGPSATVREAERRAKAALEESLRTTRAEMVAHNNELDVRIQQLGHLIGRLQTAPAGTTVPVSTAGHQPASCVDSRPPAPPKNHPVAPARSFRRLRQAERWGLVALVVAGVGAGTWGVVRWAHRPAPSPVATAAPNNPDEDNADAYTPGEPAAIADSLAQMPAASSDTVAMPPMQAEPETPGAPEAVVQPAALHVDSAAAVVQPTPLLPGTGADSAAAPASPTP
jgi:hypothetical protein